jgi:hypothetical protein
MTGPLGRISRIAFVTDMTRGDAPVIPLGFMLEAAWPDKARWLGLISRTRLTPLELDAINLTSWPQLESPYGLLNSFFDKGWAATWGEAGSTIQSEWMRSSMQITIDDNSATLLTLTPDSSVAWTATCNTMSAHLEALRAHLVPSIKAPVVGLQRLKGPAPVMPQPIASRTQTDIPMMADAA